MSLAKTLLGTWICTALLAHIYLAAPEVSRRGNKTALVVFLPYLKSDMGDTEPL